jgi:hypothetical protein
MIDVKAAQSLPESADSQDETADETILSLEDDEPINADPYADLPARLRR